VARIRGKVALFEAISTWKLARDITKLRVVVVR